MKKIGTKILLLALATVTSLQLTFFVIHFFFSWSHESATTPALKSGPFHAAELQKKDQQLENEKQEPITELLSLYLGDLSTLQFAHRTSLITKRICTHHYELLILVSSAPANAERRNNIRLTWAFRRALKPRWTTVFLVAQEKTKPLSNFLLREDEVYGDLIRADYFDQYWNQTRKIQMGFEWAIRYCRFSFLLKTDDDVFVNTAAVFSFLNEPIIPNVMLYAGMQYKNPWILRSGKWKVSREELAGVHYPDFCAGFGYILSRDVVASFVDAFSIVPFFRLDDVYVGMLANKTGIKIVHVDGFELGAPRPELQCIPSTNVKTLVRHGVKGNCLIELYNRAVLSRRDIDRTDGFSHT
ncbi:beta-1,3-galactosyltransferase 5-like [Stylophora pistillata]|uniref:beta-1,3-galactosyltransferase 5-like n=1 Tax=Stylophora pistillata TaxID=50429 RepID=UPI000C03EF1D|nr:beta-1,3-galactosyltransferase 5-like [Stylophora pistillata]